MRNLLSLCDLHYYVAVAIGALIMSILLVEQRPAFPSMGTVGTLGLLASGMVLVFGFLGLCPFELGFKGVLAWSIVNLLTGAMLAIVILVCTYAVASAFRTVWGAIF